MILFCFLLQLASVAMQAGHSRLEAEFLAIALFVTALFAGSAAAISFSGELDDKTFGFLRGLPISASFDRTSWEWDALTPWHFRQHIGQNRLRLVEQALEVWYDFHVSTLPETLDELVEAGYLKRIPVEPLTGRAMDYRREPDEETIRRCKEVRFHPQIRSKPGWPGISFGELELSLNFLPGYGDYGHKDDTGIKEIYQKKGSQP